jgi:hypothetical protein
MSKCSICKQPFEGFGHNPEPIMDYSKRCCDLCNSTVVIPVRIFGLSNPTAVAALKRHGFAVKEDKRSKSVRRPA